jgi:hypothetical protein
MGGAAGSRECAPDDKIHDTHRITGHTRLMGFARLRRVLKKFECQTARNPAGMYGFRARLYDPAAYQHEVCLSCPLSESEGAGNAGCAMHPQPRVQIGKARK